MQGAVVKRRGRRPKGGVRDGAPAAPLPEAGAIIGYARVSTDDQSLDQQVAELERAGCMRIFQEHVSATARRRPQLDAALETLRDGDVLVVWALDRFARSLPDLIKLLARLDEMGAGFRVLSQPAIDTTSPLGRLLLAVLGAVAEFELALIRTRTKAAMRRRMEQGEKFGRERILSDAQIREAQRMRVNRVSVRRVAAHFGVSPGTIRAWTLSPEQMARAKAKQVG